MSDICQIVKKRLMHEAEADYKKFSSKLVPGCGNMLGVRIPVLRKIAKEIYAQDYQSFIHNCGDEYFEEIMLQGMIIGLIKDKPEIILKFIENYIPKINNWSLCDCFCVGLKFVKKNKDLMWNFIQPYLFSKKEFEQRFGLVILLCFYVTEEYTDKIFDICNRIELQGYYDKMALAWLVSVCFVKMQEKTFIFLQDNLLDDWTFNKSIQKTIESYRVDKGAKQQLRCMKRR